MRRARTGRENSQPSVPLSPGMEYRGGVWVECPRLLSCLRKFLQSQQWVLEGKSADQCEVSWPVRPASPRSLCGSTCAALSSEVQPCSALCEPEAERKSLVPIPALFKIFIFCSSWNCLHEWLFKDMVSDFTYFHDCVVRCLFQFAPEGNASLCLVLVLLMQGGLLAFPLGWAEAERQGEQRRETFDRTSKEEKNKWEPYNI